MTTKALTNVISSRMLPSLSALAHLLSGLYEDLGFHHQPTVLLLLAPLLDIMSVLMEL